MGKKINHTTSIIRSLLIVATPLIAPSILALETIEPLRPYTGTSVRGVDTSTLTGKVMTATRAGSTVRATGLNLGGFIGLTAKRSLRVLPQSG